MSIFIDLFFVPLDRDAESIYSDTDDMTTFISTANFWEPLWQGYDRHGYPIHAYCWSLVERIIGPRAEGQLDILIKAFRERWREQSFELGECISDNIWVADVSGEELTERVFAIRDPVNIPEVQDLIRKSIENCSKERMNQMSQKRCSLFLKYLESGFPLDIQCLILDHLSYIDIQNVLVALGWQIPDSYWRGRFPKDIIFEIEELASTADVAWQFLCLGAEQLLESSHGLLNRQRIFRVLRGTRSLFFAMAGGNPED
jgi:hypothetical protein